MTSHIRSSKLAVAASAQKVWTRAIMMVKIACTLSLIVVVASAEFEPYELNGGLVTAVAGNDFCILATDTRMFNSGGYNLASRYHIKCRLWNVLDDNNNKGMALGETIEKYLRTTHTTNNHERATALQDISNKILLSKNDHQATSAITATSVASSVSSTASVPTVMIGSAGCSTDCEQLKRIFKSDLRASIHYGNVMSSMSSSTGSSSGSSSSTFTLVPNQIATLLSQTLYSRRGFPYYSFCVIAGIDASETNKIGKAYVYDAIGSYEQVAVASAGTGREALQPILDRTFTCTTTSGSMGSSSLCVDGTADDAVEKLYRAYQSVSEREIGVGDTLVVCITERKKVKGGKDDGELQRRVVLLPLKEH